MTTSLSPLHADPFWWGVGHAAFQVEGDPESSDWLEWTKIKGKIEDGANADRATEFWKKPELDVKLAKELGAKMFRLSISWERIQPAENQWDEKALLRYQAIILQIRNAGMEPLVTLHHFVLPKWLADEGGLTSERFPQLFAGFAQYVVEQLSSGPANVKWWMTFNEPMVLAYASYVTGEWPPGIKNDFGKAMRSAAQMAKAHVRATTVLQNVKIERNLKISVAAHWRDFQPATDSWLDRLTAKVASWSFNKQFINSISTGRIFFWVPGAILIWESEALTEKTPSLDYLGINYYGRTLVTLERTSPYLKVSEGPGERSEVNWEIYPKGLGNVIREAYNEYKLPILISENGVADSTDRFRGNFIRSHIEQIAESCRSGVPVLGYLHWSLTDNFEWARGIKPRFGLVEINYKSNTRKPRRSFYEFSAVIEKESKICGMPGES